MRLNDWTPEQVAHYTKLWENARGQAGPSAVFDLAQALNTDANTPITASLIQHLTGSSNRDRLYRKVRIPKRRGGFRTLGIPTRRLMWVQRSLLQLFTHVYTRHRCATAFERNKSIVSHAQLHLCRALVITLDIEDFFPTITWQRLHGALQAYPFHASPTIARHIANLATHEGALPQGAPSSPLLANMVCRKLDARLLSLARALNCRYSRYADDLAFSTNSGASPKAVIDRVSGVVHEEGFRIRHDKSRVMYRSDRQIVTGIIVNGRSPALSRAYRRNLRALLHNITQHGWRSQVNRALVFPTYHDYLQYANGSIGGQVAYRHWRQQSNERLLLNPSIQIWADNVGALKLVVAGRVAYVGQIYSKQGPYLPLQESLDRALHENPATGWRTQREVIGLLGYVPKGLWDRRDLYRRIRQCTTVADTRRLVSTAGKSCIELLAIAEKNPAIADLQRKTAQMAFDCHSDAALTGRFLAQFVDEARPLLHSPTSEPTGSEIVKHLRTLHETWRFYLTNALNETLDRFLHGMDAYGRGNGEHPWLVESTRAQCIVPFKQATRIGPGGRGELDLEVALREWVKARGFGDRCTVGGLTYRATAFSLAIKAGVLAILESMLDNSNGEVSVTFTDALDKQPACVEILGREDVIRKPPDLSQLFSTKLLRALSALRGHAGWTLMARFADDRCYTCDVMRNEVVETPNAGVRVTHRVSLYG